MSTIIFSRFSTLCCRSEFCLFKKIILWWSYLPLERKKTQLCQLGHFEISRMTKLCHSKDNVIKLLLAVIFTLDKLDVMFNTIEHYFIKLFFLFIDDAVDCEIFLLFWYSRKSAVVLFYNKRLVDMTRSGLQIFISI
jgi:hypothetical protein